MVTHSPARANWPLLEGLNPPMRGKVRDTYDLDNDNLLVVATDGASIFDIVLNTLVPLKGVILNAMNHFWLTYLAQFGFETHFVAAGRDIDQYLPKHLRNNVDLQSRAMVVRKIDIAPVEFVIRDCLTGSGWKSYQKDGTVCGHGLPSGLQNGDQLPFTILTPTTKAQEGHDEHIGAADVESRYSFIVARLREIFQIASAYAASRGIKIADTKFEASARILGDEVLTPDASRFWSMREWQESRKVSGERKPPSSFDKQILRDRGEAMGIDKLDPENPDDVAKAHAMEFPPDIIDATTKTYRYIFWRLTGRTIESYLREVLDVAVPEPAKKNVLVICGSDTDLPALDQAYRMLSLSLQRRIDVSAHIISCHRNPGDLRAFCKEANFQSVDALVVVGGKAFALPGVLDAWLHHFEKPVPVVGVALGSPGSNALLAAQLSITELPSQPVIFNELEEKAYTGREGLCQALERILIGELPPPKTRTEKPMKFGVWTNFSG